MMRGGGGRERSGYWLVMAAMDDEHSSTYVEARDGVVLGTECCCHCDDVDTGT